MLEVQGEACPLLLCKFSDDVFNRNFFVFMYI